MSSYNATQEGGERRGVIDLLRGKGVMKEIFGYFWS